MSALTDQAAHRALVAEAIDAFLELANEHPDTPRHDWGVYGFRAQASGSKYRIIMTITRDGVTKDDSVHAFVDADTGDLLKAASWKVPAKGARYNLLTEMDVVRANFGWSSGYLYADYKRKPVPAS